MIDSIIKDRCTGCEGCASVCPTKCIDMVQNYEGFFMPQVNLNKCVNCKMCINICPVINYDKNHRNIVDKKTAYAFKSNNDEFRRICSSGAVFLSLATYFIEHDGIVYGASFDGSYNVIHKSATSTSEVIELAGSKYVQSRIGDTYRQTKQFLMEGRYVLFSGTPCQLEGLFSFLRKSYEKLVTVDVVCHACPSPLVYRKYLEVQKKKIGSEFTNVLFRDKYHGYKYSTMSIICRDTSIKYHEGIDTDVMMRAFFANMSVRPSCYQCAFKKRYRNTDFTIWDCFDVDKFSKKLDNDKGVTRILAHSDLANVILKESNSQLEVLEINPNKAVEGVKEMFYSVSVNPKRDAFFTDLNILDTETCFRKYFPITLRHRLEKQVRLWTVRLGLYKHMKKLFKAIMGSREIKR